MFTILAKDFGGRKFDRYFKSWDKARQEMDKDVEDCCAHLGGKVHTKRDYFNADKGFYVYEKVAKFPNGENCTWALIDGYFEDE